MNVNKLLLKETCDYITNLFVKPARRNERVKIYYENFTRENCLFIALGKMVLAKGMQDSTGGEVIALHPIYDKQYSDICQSFGFTESRLEEESNFFDKIIASICMRLVVFFCNSPSKIINIRFKGIYIGDLIYNLIVRNHYQGYTINRITDIRSKAVVKNAFLYAVVYDRVFKENPPTYYILDEISFTDAVILRLAKKHGAVLIQYFACIYNCCFVESDGKPREPNYHSYWYKNIEKIMRKLPDDWYERNEKHLQKLFSGKGLLNSTARTAYSGKEEDDIYELKGELGIQNGKKNIIILSHCFSDTPVSSNRAVYADYYEWLEETLKLTKQYDNVNWIVRPHPMRDEYGEGGEVEKLYEKYKNPNLYWMSNQYNANMIPKLADAIITVTGTAGIEYGCLGIPCIVTGEPFYSHYGFTINVKNVDMYKRVLRNVHKIKKLTDSQILKAKEVMYAFSQVLHEQEDSFGRLSRIAAERYENDKNPFHSNNDYLRDVYEWLQHNSITDSYLYQWGYHLGDM